MTMHEKIGYGYGCDAFERMSLVTGQLIAKAE